MRKTGKSKTKKSVTGGRVRTRTSLVGLTIYYPAVKPSAKGRKLLRALDSLGPSK